MSTVGVLGAGAGGLSATVELMQAGHDVLLWNRNPATIAPFQATGRVAHAGVLGDGEVAPALLSTDLAEVVRRAEVLVVCLPSIAHGALFDDLAQLDVTVPVVLNPGHTGGALHARQVWGRHGAALPPLAELSTLTYVARVDADHVVRTTGRAGTVRAGCLPGGEQALELAVRLLPGAAPVADVLASSLSNVNLVLHPPGALLALAWVEATGGDFTFYREAMTDGVTAVLGALDDERRAVAAAFGHDLPPLLEEMTAIGTIEPGAPQDLGAAIRAGEANARIPGPDSTRHRYYREDLPFALLPLTELAGIAGVPVPTASALLALGRTVLGPEAFAVGLDSRRLGLAGLDLAAVRELVAHPTT